MYEYAFRYCVYCITLIVGLSTHRLVHLQNCTTRLNFPLWKIHNTQLSRHSRITQRIFLLWLFLLIQRLTRTTNSYPNIDCPPSKGNVLHIHSPTVHSTLCKSIFTVHNYPNKKPMKKGSITLHLGILRQQHQPKCWLRFEYSKIHYTRAIHC